MSLTRLSQQAIGEQAYEADEIEVGPALWGWTAYPATVIFDEPHVSRLGQYGIGLAAYFEDTGESTEVSVSVGNWGWQAFPVDLPAVTVIPSTANWGWTGQEPKLCSQYDVGYAGSFNANVWPTCVWNDFVFGPREAVEIPIPTKAWGWTANATAVEFFDPILVDLSVGNWGWSANQVAVSFAFEVQLTLENWGWQAFAVEVTLPTVVDTTVGNWGWTALPAAVSFKNDISTTIGSWGWTAFAVDVQAPVFDINLRVANWGWQGQWVNVKQTSLSPGDVQAVVDAIWDRLVAEGAVQQWLETWQRQGSDPNNPQTYPPQPGGSIQVGGQDILTERTPEGGIKHTRQ